MNELKAAVEVQAEIIVALRAERNQLLEALRAEQEKAAALRTEREEKAADRKKPTSS